ncbi:MAG: hypothetical protein ACO1OK_10315 [Devosia sp.]
MSDGEDHLIDQDRVATAVANLPPLVPAGWPEHGLVPHRFATVFRMLTGDERAKFDEDVLENGLREEIVVFEGQILDGRNRYLAIVEAGYYDPECDFWQDFPEFFERFDGTEIEAADFVVSRNEQRRHDTPTQRAVAAARLARVRDMSQAEAAQIFGVSERQVSSASHALQHGVPELAQAMDDGRLPGYLAEKVADLDEDEQREIAAAPKGEASAKAREKLQDPPPMSESGPVVKAMPPDLVVMFAEAVIAVAACGHGLTTGLLDALAREHNLLADRDGAFNTRPEFGLLVELCRKRLGISSGRVRDADIVIATAGLPEDLDALTTLYKQALIAFDRAVIANDPEASAKAQIAMEAVLFKANGSARSGVAVNDAPQSIIAACRLPDGAVPLWGQDGCFIAEAGDVRAIVELDARWGKYQLRPVDFLTPFPHGSGVTYRYFMGHGGEQFSGMSVAEAGRVMIERAVGATKDKAEYADDMRGMFLPETIYRLDPESRNGPVLLERGVELVAGDWPFMISEDHFRERCKVWKAEYAYGAPRGKKAFPKPRHRDTHIWSIGKDVSSAVADFPLNGAYLIENNGRWRYVDDGTDPGADAVTARMTGSGALPDRSAYLAALDALTEPRGKLHQSTAADALRAGVAARVPVREMARDLGHPVGTVQTWTFRLNLTDPNRNPVGRKDDEVVA